ncbi:MAG: transglycosylase SLT domain-containing protein [Rudaea sp.]|nr:transglycosylase SLT domain-containing protein [Rudaea sp.]
MSCRILFLTVALTLAACAGQPPHAPNQSGAGSSPTAALYARLDAAVGSYESARSTAGNGNAESAMAESTAALDDLQAAAAQCATTRGCETSRFFAAFDRLLRLSRSVPVAIDAAAGAESPDATAEAGESSPVVAALPEAGRAVALLKGRQLSDIIALNDPVKVALQQWLTQYRPNLMQAYENYAYLRYRMWPEYQKAGLPEAVLFGILAKESGGKVHAVSRSGASGPLQFMSATGARFGLGIVDGFDQRFDPTLSARANAAYLDEQLGVFNDNLELVLGAYNGGEGAMQRLATRHPDAGFWDAKIYSELSPETRDYVPMVLAAAWLFLHPERYNLVFPRRDGKPSSITLKRAASINELTVCLGSEDNSNGWFRTLRNLNPAYEPQQELAAGTRLDVPEKVAAVYEKSCAGGKWVALASDLSAAALPLVAQTKSTGRTRNYIVRKGDTVASIAHRHACGGSGELVAINHLKAPHYALQVGQSLQIPSVCSRN